MRAPTLVIWGRQDRWLPVEQAERVRGAIPGARLEVIDACGHMPQEERPAEVTRTILRFVGAPSLGPQPLDSK